MNSNGLGNMDCLKISIKGIVQGVGFRPFVYNLANELSLKGYVTNTSDGVLISVEGDNLEHFIERIRTDSPPLSKIMSVDISPDEPRGYADFEIRKSTDTGRFTLVSPDISICNECFGEILDVKNRRYRYPFINCTNCGPRYTITKSVPYDRMNTTMYVFKMCRECEKEYHNPSDRRFHAQPNACPVCGPHVELQTRNSDMPANENPIKETIRLLKEGNIVAIKGLGGFHIACDASNREVVEKLRERKRRSNKPFALMAPDINAVKKFCHVSEYEEKVLLSAVRPIVLLRKRSDLTLPAKIAPQNNYLGFMLPYTPLHYLLFFSDDSLECSEFSALIMTSGNISEEPIIISNDEATLKLGNIADAFLLHNRDIYMRVDDSVIAVDKDSPLGRTYDSSSGLTYVRRSRGFAPYPIPLHDDGPDVLGSGADIKNTFTLTKGRYAIPSQHIGDMENYETLTFFEETLNNLKKIYRAEPEAIAYDLHPRYLSSLWALGQESGNGQNIVLLGVQHHYANIE
jgi:hydrogenase maturation protein HypF